LCSDACIPVPAPVLALAGGEAVRPVWVNELAGTTFEIGAAGRRRFVKWAPDPERTRYYRLLWDLGP
jgi:hypothetical protein